MKPLWIAGYPSPYGGADTELDHNIDLWRMMGIEVNLVPMFGATQEMRKSCEDRGCITHEYRPEIFKDKIVASWCNGGFLDKLPEIMDKGRPETVVWFNCMTWPFEKELAAHSNGWINLFGFVSAYQEQFLMPRFAEIAPAQALAGYRPYFNTDRVQFSYRKPDSHFAIGRVSRDDPAKFSEDMWRIFDRVLTPRAKKVFVLGYTDKIQKKTGPPPSSLDWQWWVPNSISVSELYGRLHCLLHKTGGSRESYGRIVPESYAYGVPIIVEDDYAFPELVIDGVTGFRCRSSDEMSFRASQLAFDENLRKDMIHAGRDHLKAIASADACRTAWEKLLS